MNSLTSLLVTALALSAQATDPVDEAVVEAVRAMERAAEEAASAPIDEAAKETARKERVAEIDATMRLIAGDPSLGEKFPLPRYVRTDELQAAMRHGAAWISGTAKTDRIDVFIEAADNTGRALYYEWACRTGREREVAQAFFDALDANLTSYPQRLLLTRNMNERELMGYGNVRRCSAQALETWRGRQTDALRRVSA